MRVMITTSGGNIAIHNKIVELVNALYGIEEVGSNGGKGDYFSHANNDYAHIKSPIADKWRIQDVTIWVDTVEDSDYDTDSDDD